MSCGCGCWGRSMSWRTAGREPVSGLRRKAVLATLALHDGELVSTGRLVDVVWGEAAPPTAREHAAEPRVLSARCAGLQGRDPRPSARLRAGTRRRRHRRAGRRSGCCGRAGRSADPRPAAPGTCGRRWRCGAGRPLADVAGLAWLEEQARRLDLLGEQVRRALSEARLAAGEHAQLVPDLEQMVADHPLDEQIHAQLMLALYRGGRQADALAAYQRLRRTLDEELGIDPSQALRDLEVAILRQDPSSGRASPPRSPAAAAGPVRRWRRFRRSCRRRWPASPAAPRSWPPRTRVAAATARPAGRLRARTPPRWSSRRSRAPPGWARPRWPCTGRTGWRRSSPTGSCT